MSKTLFSDNTLVKQTPDSCEYLSIHVTENNAFINRYVVPGRTDTYTFKWNPSHECGVGDTVSLFTDHHLSLSEAVKMVRQDLKRPRVKAMLQDANTKLRRSYLFNLLEALR